MNHNSILLSVGAAGAAAAAIYLWVKKSKKMQPAINEFPGKQSRHLTTVFAKAKHGGD